VSDRRDHAVTFRWSHPWMSGVHTTTLEFDTQDERDRAAPHIDALIAMWREKEAAKVTDAPVKLFEI
jgi:hypothetical protein